MKVANQNFVTMEDIRQKNERIKNNVMYVQG
jgi:hypothetical protein